MCLHCFSVYVWWILSNPELFVSECCYHSITPPQRYLPHPLISALVCLPSHHLVRNLSTSSYFTPGVQLHRTRVRKLPSSHLYSLTLVSHSEILIPKHSKHMHSLALLSDLQRSWSVWLIHWRTVGLFKLLRLESDKSTIPFFLFKKPKHLIGSLIVLRERLKRNIWCTTCLRIFDKVRIIKEKTNFILCCPFGLWNN